MANRRQVTIDAFLGANLLKNRSLQTPAAPRSASEASTQSCITLNNDAPSSTPPTSIDCGSSSMSLSLDNKTELPIDVRANATATAATAVEQDQEMEDADATTTTITENNAAGRSRRARTSVATYNENTLIRNNTTRRSTAASTSRKRDLSGTTLVATDNELDNTSPGKAARDSLVQESIQVLDLDWAVDALPGERLTLGSQDDADMGKSAEGRSKALLRKATAAVDKTKTVLGKRTREIIDAGKSGARGAKDIGRRASLRARDVLQQTKDDKAPEESQPDAKRRKTDKGTVAKASESSADTIIASSSAPSKRKAPTVAKDKRWLRQGLYVGQQPEFDPRLKPGDNGKRAQKMREKYQKQQQKPSANDELFAKKRTILPLPMFAGKRLFDNGRDWKLPFDVFHPLPPGQPKPDEWRRTGRNHFVGDSAEYWKVSKKLEYSTCLCTAEQGCDEDCFNRCMFYECDSNNCNLGAKCGNRPFLDLKERVKKGGKYNIGVEVLKTENKGYGVRTCRTFEPAQIIVEYTGEIITQDECDRRMRTMYKDNECFYLMEFDQNMIIDATRGSIARFVNHSCEPNCRMVKWTVDGKPRMALFAGDSGITTGEELTYDYNFDPFSAKNIQECHCGSALCRGVLGPKLNPREIKDGLKALADKSGNASLSASSAAAAASTTTAARTAGSLATNAKRKLKDAVDEVRAKKRRLSQDLSALVSAKQAHDESVKRDKADRAARAALRADIKSAKSRRVVAAKLTKRTANGAKVTVVKVGSSPSKSLSKPVAGSPLKRVVSKGPVGTMRRSVDTVRSNVVRTIRGARGAGGAASAAPPVPRKGKTIKVIQPDQHQVVADAAAAA